MPNELELESVIARAIEGNLQYVVSKRESKFFAQAVTQAIRDSGRVVVPAEPTEAMLRAGREAANYHKQQSGVLSVALQVWPAMIEAAQQDEGR